jgi:diguanylate cyclase
MTMVSPPYADSPESAAENLRLALPLMSRHGVPTHPLNIALWYDYVSGRNEDLKQAMDRAINDGEPLSEALHQSLYERFFVTDQPGLEQLKRDLLVLIMELQRELKSTGGNLTHYIETLQLFALRLQDQEHIDLQSAEVEKVVVETKSTRVPHQQLDARLASVVTEVEGLRTELDRIRTESLTDGLTGIANRKAFDAALEGAIDAAERDNRPFSVLLADIDRFKDFNDIYGHLVGDRILRFVARMLKRCVKGSDKPARYGGEEFAVVLPNTFLSGAQVVAEQIRHQIEAAKLTNRTTGEEFGTITISIGVAQFHKGETATHLLQRADRPLYQAKKRGRNRVHSAHQR